MSTGQYQVFARNSHKRPYGVLKVESSTRHGSEFNLLTAQRLKDSSIITYVRVESAVSRIWLAAVGSFPVTRPSFAPFCSYFYERMRVSGLHGAILRLVRDRC